MKGTDVAVLISALFVAIPAFRAAWRVLSARYMESKADRMAARMGKAGAQEREADKATINRLRNDAHDLIEFSTLVPTWALLTGLFGIVLNIVARAIVAFSS